MHDKLKDYKDIFKPDPRIIRRVIMPSGSTKLEEYPLERYYSLIKELSLNNSVPELIVAHFDIGRNLLLYSWFVYSFNQVAQLHAFESLEYALRETFPDANLKPRPTLNNLLDHAIKIEVVREEFFNSDTMFMKHFQRYSSQDTVPDGYCQRLVENVSKIRNTLAHGSYQIGPFGFFSIGLCRAIINQLYR